MRYLLLSFILLSTAPAFAQVYVPKKINLDGIEIGKTSAKDILDKYGKPSKDGKVMGFKRAAVHKGGQMHIKWVIEEIGHKLIYDQLGLAFTFYTTHVSTSKAESLHSIYFRKKSGVTITSDIQVGIHTVKYFKEHVDNVNKRFARMPLQLGLFLREKGYNIRVMKDLRGTVYENRDLEVIDTIEVENMHVIKYK